MTTPSTAVSPEPDVYIIKSKLRGTDITLKGGEGATLTAWANPTDGDHHWQISPLGKGEYSIISNSTGFSISAVKGKAQVATAQFSPPKDANVRWTFEAIGTPTSGDL
ncbi:hypothetical protein MMC31_005028 [Peltigera leucophlebia]|nr:hypothetical protein [Peltigera leucophlebia]